MAESKFMIGGTIVADDSQRWAFEDVTPVQVRSALSHLAKGEGITFEISSPGGDVTAGLAIANLIRAASAAQHHCRAHVIGIAASMASVIACACDEIDIDESAFLMIHNPWTVTQGDAASLRKDADLLDKMRDAIMGFYRSKFDKTDDELKALMDDETWFTGKEADTYGFRANVIANAEPLRAAACARALPIFNKIPQNAAGLFVLGKHEDKPMNEKPANTTEVITLAECEKRVSGMQSTMAKQLDQLRADFQNQLAAKDEELTKARAEVTRLTDAVKKAEGELQETASALKLKSDALATLNANVNAPAPAPTYKELMAKAKTPEEREALRARKRSGEFN